RLRALRRLRQRSYDLVWNLHGGSTSLLLAMAPQSNARMGFEHFRQANRYTHRVPSAAGIWGKTPVHTVETQLAPLKWLGLPRHGTQFLPRGYVSPEASRTAESFLEQHRLSRRPFVLIQPTATLRTKQWPEEKFAQLLERIRSKYGMDVVLSTGPGEEGVAHR